MILLGRLYFQDTGICMSSIDDLTCTVKVKLCFSPQSNSAFSIKAETQKRTLRNGHHAESWKSFKQQSLQDSSEKIK
ncbi:hypothetical protein GOODEAATRI_027064, partial [Goodea atripinnis]